MRTQTHWPIAVTFALIGLVTCVAPSSVRAGVDADVRAGVFANADAVGVGAGVLAPMGSRSRWYANPNAEVAMGDTENLVSLNGDFHCDISHQTTTSVWLGAGPAILIQDREGDNRSDLGINLLAGMGKTRGSVRPFGQIKGVVADNNGGVALVGGVRF